eukprot:2534304-Karenia_brevis.AAC.1
MLMDARSSLSDTSPKVSRFDKYVPVQSSSSRGGTPAQGPPATAPLAVAALTSQGSSGSPAAGSSA